MRKVNIITWDLIRPNIGSWVKYSKGESIRLIKLDYPIAKDGCPFKVNGITKIFTVKARSDAE